MNYFAPGQAPILTLFLVDFQPDVIGSKDFKVSASLSASYYDTQPLATTGAISFSVEPSYQLLTSVGVNQAVSYTMEIENLEADGKGMTVGIFRVPSCMQIDFNYLETLSNNGMFDMHEIVKGNTEIVMYWRQLAPQEVKQFEIRLTKVLAGTCYEKPHTAYLYYSKEDVYWV